MLCQHNVPILFLLHDASILPHTLRKRVMTKLFQEKPTQPSLLLPSVIDMQVAFQLLALHTHPLNQMWISPSTLHLGTPPMRATIIPNQIPALHGILKCHLLKDQFDPIRTEIGGRKKPPIMMCMAQEVSNTNMRDVIHSNMSSIYYMLL